MSGCSARDITGHVPGHSDRLAGQVCVITGAAGVIAEANAERLKREGATVVGIDQREHTVGELSLRADLTDEEQVRRSFARVHSPAG
jgi:NAD(P)-dependent dehydrogenase (short-subunit alcohol dehydrogenase family)